MIADDEAGSLGTQREAISARYPIPMARARGLLGPEGGEKRGKPRLLDARRRAIFALSGCAEGYKQPPSDEGLLRNASRNPGNKENAHAYSRNRLVIVV